MAFPNGTRGGGRGACVFVGTLVLVLPRLVDNKEKSLKTPRANLLDRVKILARIGSSWFVVGTELRACHLNDARE
jgi:hypothetical protein